MSRAGHPTEKWEICPVGTLAELEALRFALQAIHARGLVREGAAKA